MRRSILFSVIAVALFVHAGTARAVDVPLNLALGKTAIASSSESGNRPDAAADGDNGTRWCAADDSAGQWWQVDLQQPEDLASCRINWEFDGVRYRHKIEGSVDGKAWATLVDRTGVDAAAQREQAHKLDAKGVRFVRVTVTGLETGRWASFHEFELYGGKTVNPTTLTRKKNASLLREIKAPAGLKLTLFAAPPDVSYPVCLTAAANGDVFVAVDPNGSLDQKRGRGKIIRCRDTNGDGAADEFVTFAQLDSPRGMVWDEANATMYVVHPPLLSAYHDENVDGVAERNDVLVEGLGFDLNFRGADHTTNGVQIGIDGWLYIAVGDYGFVKATGRDGKSLQLRGGGVVRVRPDGTRLEIVSRGQRNIYDVAISPTMDLFTRDNTNDGDGWDEHLSHVTPLAQFGYPSLFKNFPGEWVKPLAEYGGGSPTGSLYLDEPGFHEGLGRALYTCDWGTNRIDCHPLRREGATFKAEQQSFIEMPRPVDIDVDGSSRLYVASWRGGGFAYTAPDVGYVARLIDPAHTPPNLVDLKKATEKQLLAELSTDSHVRRLRAQREIVRRGATPDVLKELGSLAHPPASIETRVAATFALAQLKGPEAGQRIQWLIGGEEMREYALAAAIDQADDASAVPVEPYIAALKHADGRIRLQGVVGMARMGRADVAFHLLPSLADPDRVVAQAAVEALVQLRAADACFLAVDRHFDSHAGALRALQRIHEPAAVDGLIARAARVQDWIVRHAILKALCRLYHREADWTGGWWGTRPDTSGPYFQPVTWDQSEKILKALRRTLADAEPRTVRFLLVELQRHKIELPEATAKLLELAMKDDSLRASAIDLLATRPNVPAEAHTLFVRSALSRAEKPQRRARALAALCRSGESASLAAVSVLAQVGDDAPAELKSVRGEYVRDAGRAKDVRLFAALATRDDATFRELGMAVLLQIAANQNSPQDALKLATNAIGSAWTKPQTAASLLRAIGREKVDGYEQEIRARLSDPDPAVKDAANFAASRLGSAGEANKVTIANVPYEQTLAAVLKRPGDPKAGGELFIKQSCASCHTVSRTEPPKGPFLGDIGKRYSRAELIESILKPNTKIAQGFVTHYYVTKKRERTDGFIVREAGDEVELRTATGASVTIKNADVARNGTLQTSIMPEQLVGNLSAEEVASLVAYLESLKGE